MAIREATEADLPALAPLLRGYVTFYESDPTDEQLAEMARDVINAPEEHAFLLVATDEQSRVVGFALNQWKWSSLNGARVVVMDDLFVAEDARGAGHADALIEAVADVARRHGAPLISWFTMPDNKRAHTVYDRVGGTAETLLEYELRVSRARP
jgi:GNAT superfamily N-acetyltransferase